MIIRSADFAKFEVPPLRRESLGSNLNNEIAALIGFVGTGTSDEVVSGLQNSKFSFVASIARQLEDRRCQTVNDLMLVGRTLFPEELDQGVVFVPLRRVDEQVHRRSVGTPNQVVEHGGSDLRYSNHLA